MRRCQRDRDDRPPRVTDLGNLPPSQPRPFTRIDGAAARADSGAVAEEVPVAFVYGGKPHVVMMCTPADLEDLAIGFTISEEITGRATDIVNLAVVRHARGVEIQMELPPEAQARVATARVRSRAAPAAVSVASTPSTTRSARRAPWTRSRHSLPRPSPAPAMHSPLSSQSIMQRTPYTPQPGPAQQASSA